MLYFDLVAPAPVALSQWQWAIPTLCAIAGLGLSSMAVLLFPSPRKPPVLGQRDGLVRFMLRIEGVQLISDLNRGRALIEGTIEKRTFVILWPDDPTPSGLIAWEEVWPLSVADLWPRTLELEFRVRCGTKEQRWELFSDEIGVGFAPIEGPTYGSAFLYTGRGKERWPRPFGVIQYSIRTAREGANHG